MNQTLDPNYGAEHAAPGSRRRLQTRMAVLLPAVFVCSATAGYLAGVRTQLEPQPSLDAAFAFPGEFEGAAFAEDAATDDLLAVAELAAEEVADDYPESPLALSVAARKAYLLSDTEKSAEIWRRSLELDPMFADGFFGLGLIMMDRDEYKFAGQYFQEVEWRAPDDPRAPVLAADAMLNAGEVDNSILTLEEIASAPGASAAAITLLGQAHLQARQYEEARRKFELVVQNYPNTAKAVYGLAQVYARQGEPERAKIFTQRFEALDRQERDARAEAAKQFVDKQYATHVAAQAHHDAARVYRKFGDLSKAEQMWRKAAALEPDDAEHLSQLLSLFESQQRHAECLQVAERLAALEPSNADYWLNVGVLNASLGRHEEALSAFQRAVSLDPDNPRSRQVIEQLQDF